MSFEKQYLEIGNFFIKSLSDVFEMMMDTKIESSKPELLIDKQFPFHSLTSIIRMDGALQDQSNKNFKGSLSISWPESTFLEIAKVIHEKEYTHFCDEIADTGNEIVNMVMGSSKKPLLEIGYNVGMASPTFIKGQNYSIVTGKNKATVFISVKSKLGPFRMGISHIKED